MPLSSPIGHFLAAGAAGSQISIMNFKKLENESKFFLRSYNS